GGIFMSWFRFLFGGQEEKTAQRRQFYRPNLESLEDRTVPSTFPLGGNVNPLVDWDFSNTFVDMFKQARQPTALNHSGAANVDANGWPTEDFEVILQTGGLNLGHVYDGTYHLSFTGKATVTTAWTPNASISNVVYNATTNTTTEDITLN